MTSKKKILLLLMFLIILPIPISALTIYPDSNGCNRQTGYCESNVDLSKYLNTTSVTAIKSMDLTNMLPKTSALSVTSHITSINYKLNGNNLTIFGYIQKDTSTYWTMDLGTYATIDPYWNASGSLSSTASSDKFSGIKINTTNGTMNLTRVSTGSLCTDNNISVIRVSNLALVGSTTTKGGTWFNFTPPLTLNGSELYYIVSGSTNWVSHTICYDPTLGTTPIQTENFLMIMYSTAYPTFDFQTWSEPRAEKYDVNGTETTLIILDSTPPTYANNGTNNSNPAPLAQVLYYTNWSDNSGLSGYIFSWNATGATCSDGFANDTWVVMTGLTNWSNVTKQAPLACAGKVIDFLFFANDTSNNWNKTVNMFETEGKIPTSTNLTINSGVGNISHVYTTMADNITAYVNVSGLPVNITVNGIQIASGITSAIVQYVFPVGVWNVTSYYIGNNSHNSSLTTIWANITQASRTCSLTTDKGWARNYDGTNSSTDCSVSNASADGTESFAMNWSNIEFPPDLQSEIGIYNYTCQWNEGANFSDCIQQNQTLTIATMYNVLNLTFNTSDSIIQGMPVLIECAGETSVNLYNDTDSISNPYEQDTTSLSGLYNYTCNTTGDAEYSANTTSRTLSIDMPFSSNSTFSYTLCYDNQTLLVNSSVFHNGVLNNTFEYIYCPTGCDDTTAVCNPPLYQQYLIILTVIIFLCIGGAWLIKWARRR